MATNTENLGLQKDLATEFYNIDTINANLDKIDAFAGRKDNPHNVTKEQIGLDKVDNTSDAEKPVSTPQATAISEAKAAGTSAQANLTVHINDKENPHNVTKAQVGLDKVNNTADSEKSVNTANFASEAGESRKVQSKLVVRFKGGSTEGTDKWEFDGSTGKSINITPAKIGASESSHTHTLDGVSETTEKKICRIVVATRIEDTASGDGQIVCNYVASADGIEELYNGLEITIIPDESSKFSSTEQTLNHITLNLNNLGAIPVRQPLSCSTFVAITPDINGFIAANTPCRLMYHENYVSGGIWLMADKVKYSAQDLYGIVPIESGGTGADNGEEALHNFGVADYITEQGTSGVWKYRKWKNGTVDLWGTLTDLRSENSNSEYSHFFTYTLPFAVSNATILGNVSGTKIVCDSSISENTLTFRTYDTKSLITGTFTVSFVITGNYDDETAELFSEA